MKDIELARIERGRDEDGSTSAFRVTFYVPNGAGDFIYAMEIGHPLPSEENLLKLARHHLAMELEFAASLAKRHQVSPSEYEQLRRSGEIIEQ